MKANVLVTVTVSVDRTISSRGVASYVKLSTKCCHLVTFKVIECEKKCNQILLTTNGFYSFQTEIYSCTKNKKHLWEELLLDHTLANQCYLFRFGNCFWEEKKLNYILLSIYMHINACMYGKSMALDFYVREFFQVHGIQKGSFKHRFCMIKN